MPKYLLDSNLLIAALDHQGSADETAKAAARKTLRELLRDANSELALTPLIKYEVLRGVCWAEADRFDALKAALSDFHTFDINSDMAELSAQLFRYDRQEKPYQLNKRQFDVMHFATAKCLNIQLVSEDGDMQMINAIYERLHG